MSVLYILIPLALLLGASALVAFLMSLKRGQFDDLETPPWRALFEEEVKKDSPTAKGAAPAPKTERPG